MEQVKQRNGGDDLGDGRGGERSVGYQSAEFTFVEGGKGEHHGGYGRLAECEQCGFVLEQCG